MLPCVCLCYWQHCVLADEKLGLVWYRKVFVLPERGCYVLDCVFVFVFVYLYLCIFIGHIVFLQMQIKLAVKCLCHQNEAVAGV